MGPADKEVKGKVVRVDLRKMTIVVSTGAKEIDQLLQFQVSLLESRLRSVALDGDSSTNPLRLLSRLVRC